MATYTFSGTATSTFTIAIEADTYAEAEDRAQEADINEWTCEGDGEVREIMFLECEGDDCDR